MFINCPHCQALVATDPATDLPPERCPRCAEHLRERATQPASAPATPAVTTPVPDPVSGTDVGGIAVVDASSDDAAQPGEQASSPSGIAAALPEDTIESLPRPSAAAAPISSPIAPIATMLKWFGASRPPQGDTAAAPEPVDAGVDAPSAAVASAHDATSRAADDTAMRDAQVDPLDNASMPAPMDAAQSVATVSVANDTPVATTAIEPATRFDASLASPALATSNHPDDLPPDAARTSVDDQDEGHWAVHASAADRPAAATEQQPAQAASIAVEKPGPSFARRRPVARAIGWKTIAAIVALGLLLGLQLLLADRARLAADARWRPLLTSLCGALGCALPAWHEPSAFIILARDVRPHPRIAGALHVTASFRNDARWAQDWPRLRLVLSDVDGNAVAGRDFSVAQYLGAPPSQSKLASGQSASVAFDVLEPGQRSVAFDFTLH